mmetsp:Transcript_23269/g.62389  ORF Transcript_23269/g.62389 Transcript_23269/m.62389 type:complete len:201 (-) Transcript_23269:1962-2564(-)
MTWSRSSSMLASMLTVRVRARGRSAASATSLVPPAMGLHHANALRFERSIPSSYPLNGEPGSDRATSGGAWPTKACAIVPLKPKLLTPATNASVDPTLLDVERSDSSSVGKRTGTSFTTCAILGFNVLSSAFGGACSCCSTSTVLISPAMPAAASVCPMLAFTPPITSGCCVPRLLPSTALTARISIGSPMPDPVPKASK